MSDALPIVYHPDYNITLGGLERLHPFDSTKYGRIAAMLAETLALDTSRFVMPEEVDRDTLLRVHDWTYLEALRDNHVVAQVLELPLVSAVPMFLVERALLKPMRLATGGTIVAARMALERGWAINLAGGYHHAKGSSGEGFCVYADVPLALDLLWAERPELRVAIVDLDAHLGNGNATLLGQDPRVVLYDAYNAEIYPDDPRAEALVDHAQPLRSGTTGEAYLERLRLSLPAALREAGADLVVYNAGTDVYRDDPLGALALSADDILARDKLVVELSREIDASLLWVPSGGYTHDSARLVADSLGAIFGEELRALA